VIEDKRLSVSAAIAFTTFAIVAFTPQIFNDGDTYLHIAAGARMLKDGAVLFRDPFSFTFAGRPWIAHEWLSEILMALCYRAAGWGAVALATAACFALTLGLLAFHLSRWFSLPRVLIIVTLAAACMTPGLLARPHILALPLLEIWTAGLVFARSESRAPNFALLPVMMLWANLHGGFIAGLGLLGCLAIEAFVESQDRRHTLKEWGLFALAAILAASATPHFFDGLLFPFRLGSMPALAHIGEWRPANFSSLSPFELVFLASLYVLLSRGVRLPAGRAAILLFLAHMSLQHQRHQILFALMAPLLAADALAPLASPPAARTRIRIGAVAATFALVATVSFARLTVPAPRGGQAVTPEAALSSVPRSLAAKPVLNDYAFGGYLIFKGVRPFIDSRAELYGDDFLQQYARIVRPGPDELKAVLNKYRIEWTIFSSDSPAVAVLDVTPGWRRAYTDAIAVVHVRIRKR
jgi:hypothetical protein